MIAAAGTYVHAFLPCLLLWVDCGACRFGVPAWRQMLYVYSANTVILCCVLCKPRVLLSWCLGSSPVPSCVGDASCVCARCVLPIGVCHHAECAWCNEWHGSAVGLTACLCVCGFTVLRVCSRFMCAMLASVCLFLRPVGNRVHPCSGSL